MSDWVSKSEDCRIGVNYRMRGCAADQKVSCHPQSELQVKHSVSRGFILEQL